MAVCLNQAALVHLCCVAVLLVCYCACTAKVVLAWMEMLDAVGIECVCRGPDLASMSIRSLAETESVACDLALWLLVD